MVECVELVGGLMVDNLVVLIGGIMMGGMMIDLLIFVFKKIGGIIVLLEDYYLFCCKF